MANTDPGSTTTDLPQETRPGVGTDAAGGSVVDPSKNVLDLVEAGNQRQDDLRRAEQDHIREVLALRAELGSQDSRCASEIADLRARHSTELREAEAARINAIRSVDVEAVQRAAEVQAAQAGTLAAQVATSAETLRTQVAAAATAAQVALAAALEPIIKDIADLRRAQYEAQGQKTQVVETQAKGSSVWLAVGGVVGGFVLLLLLIGTIVALTSGGR